jgi:hypothetical protein
MLLSKRKRELANDSDWSNFQWHEIRSKDDCNTKTICKLEVTDWSNFNGTQLEAKTIATQRRFTS